MRHHPPSTALLLAAFLCTLAPCSQAAIATFALDLQEVTASSAVLNVRLTLDGDPGDEIDVIQLSVIGSDPLLTAGDTDFSRFSFDLNPSILPDWEELSPISPLGFGLYAPDDPPAGPFFSVIGSSELNGQLAIDLTGVPGGRTLFVTLADGDVGLQTDVSGTVGGLPIFSFRDSPTDDVQFAAPQQLQFTTLATAVPEPTTLAIYLALTTLALRRHRRRRRRRSSSSSSSSSRQ